MTRFVIASLLAGTMMTMSVAQATELKLTPELFSAQLLGPAPARFVPASVQEQDSMSVDQFANLLRKVSTKVAHAKTVNAQRQVLAANRLPLECRPRAFGSGFMPDPFNAFVSTHALVC